MGDPLTIDNLGREDIIISRKCHHFHFLQCHQEYLTSIPNGDYPFTIEGYDAIVAADIKGCRSCSTQDIQPPPQTNNILYKINYSPSLPDYINVNDITDGNLIIRPDTPALPQRQFGARARDPNRRNDHLGRNTNNQNERRRRDDSNQRARQEHRDENRQRNGRRGSGDRREDRDDRRGERERNNRSYRDDRREGRGRDTRGYGNDYHQYSRDINNQRRY